MIANAGTSAGTGGQDESKSQARDIFAINLAGVLNAVWPVITAMRGRGRGQIAIVSSIVGFRDMPGTPVYLASKAAVQAYGEARRGAGGWPPTGSRSRLSVPGSSAPA